jgi:hypothetical protein
MKLHVRHDRPADHGRLIYVVDDHAFDFLPRISGGQLGTVTLSIDTLQLDADIETGQIVGVWGYFPREGWKPAHLSPPPGKPGTLHVSFERPVESGASYALNADAKWRALFDATTGWLSIKQTGLEPSEFVEYADGLVAGLAGNRLAELWLHPEFVDSLGTK